MVAKERSVKRRELAKRRKKLGFNDKGADEVDDDHMEYLEAVKSQQLNQSHDGKGGRTPVVMPTELQGISISDRQASVVRPGEEFKKV